MTFNGFKEWAFLTLLAGGVVVLYQMKETVSEINTKLAVVLVEQNIAKIVLSDHESRLREIEKKTK